MLSAEGNRNTLIQRYDEFVKSVHGMEGVNRWVRVHDDKEDTAKMQKELEAKLNEEGWRVDFAVGDAAEWEDEDE